MSEQIMTKNCPKCKQTKPISEFTKNRSRKDGLLYWCKTCHKVYKQAYKQSESGKAVNRKAKAKYQQTPNGKATHRKGNAKYKQTPKGRAADAKYFKTPKGKATLRKAEAKRNARNPNYPKAKHAVNHTITAGKLPRANTRRCYYCPEQAEQYHHWLGYEPEHWLDVVPVCVECHRNIHKVTAQYPSTP